MKLVSLVVAKGFTVAQTAYAMPNQQMPNEIYQQAAANGLGELIAVYKPKYTNPLAIIGIVLAVIIADIIALVVSFYVGFIFYILGVVPILVIIWAINALLHCNLRVYMFSNGFINGRGRNGEVVRWDQVKAIWEDAKQGRSSGTFTYTVQRNDGKILKQGNPLQNSKDMGVQMMREIIKIHLPLAKAAYDAGQTLSFGKINVDRQGLNNGKEMVPWSQIGRVTTQQGIVCIEKDGRVIKWSSVKSAEVPNLAVLMTLVSHIVQR
jgi:hypothetical protein